MIKEVTMLSTLPPIVGMSHYTKGLVRELSQKIKVYFLGFNHIYPSFLFPGALYDKSAKPFEETENFKIRNVLDWFNPVGWIIEAFRIKTDVIHAQWWSYPLAPIYFTILGINKLRGKKIILTIHNVIPHERSFLKILCHKSIFYLGDEYIVHTQKNKQALQEIIKNKPIHVIPHGLIENPLKGISQKEARASLHMNDEDKILLCFGHIRDYKGIDVAIKALSLIKDTKIKLLIAGKCWEDGGKYKQLIEKYKLNERIFCKLDYMSSAEVEVLFKATDLILLPYKHFDAQSGVGALGLPYEIPMIVSNTGGLTDYVKDKRCVVEPGNAWELAEKIEYILSDKELYNKLVEDTKEIKKTLQWDAIAQETIRIYE